MLGNKCDIATPEQVEGVQGKYIEAQGLTFLPISAATRRGVDRPARAGLQPLQDLPPVKVYEASTSAPTRTPSLPRPSWSAPATTSLLSMPLAGRILAGTNVEDYEACEVFRPQLGDSGILDELWSRRALRKRIPSRSANNEFGHLY